MMMMTMMIMIMKNKKAQELLDKAIKLNYGDEIPLFKGIYI